MVKKTTSYLGINKNISEITAFHVCKRQRKTKTKGEQIEEDEGEDSHVVAYAESAKEQKIRVTDYPYAEIKPGTDPAEIEKILGI